jgi:hypothetical protein
MAKQLQNLTFKQSLSKQFCGHPYQGHGEENGDARP